MIKQDYFITQEDGGYYLYEQGKEHPINQCLFYREVVRWLIHLVIWYDKKVNIAPQQYLIESKEDLFNYLLEYHSLMSCNIIKDDKDVGMRGKQKNKEMFIDLMENFKVNIGEYPDMISFSDNGNHEGILRGRRYNHQAFKEKVE